MNHLGIWRWQVLLLLSAFALPAVGRAEEPTALIATLRAVGNEGAGNEQASRACRALREFGPEVLPGLLAALDDARPSAAHWLRTAFENGAENALARKMPLPLHNLEVFARDRRHSPRARYLAYDWLTRADPSAPGRLLPEFLDDPSLELRRDAVATVIEQGARELARNDRGVATATFRKALSHVRDRDQVEQVIEELEKLGVEVDLTAHLGFLREWLILGPFDNTADKGLDVALPPEKKTDVAGRFEGKGGREIRWQAHRTTAEYGAVDFNPLLGKDKEVLAYALAVVESDREQPVELRAGSNNEVQMFLNGVRVYSRAIGHQGMRIDQHVGRGTLKAGPNEVLIKVCRDGDTRTASSLWGFQLRLCDAQGGAVPVRMVSPEPPAQKGQP